MLGEAGLGPAGQRWAALNARRSTVQLNEIDQRGKDHTVIPPAQQYFATRSPPPSSLASPLRSWPSLPA